MLALGNRVGSKNKSEHRDAITGLAQIYHKHYLKRKLTEIQEGGEDINIGDILETLHAECVGGKKKRQDKFAWIPAKVFDCMFYSDMSDPDMRNRVFQIVDDVLLGSAKSNLSPTSRAVGLAMILSSLKEKESSKKWMSALFLQRANLQRALGTYLDARLKWKNCESGSAEAFTADAEAMEKLEAVAHLTASSGLGSPNSEAFYGMLKKFHTAKDKHIFRILSTIANSTHSSTARARAFDELPKRTKSLGTETSTWVKVLARRCAMGCFFNTEIIEHCIILSQESFEADDCEASALFLECVKTASSVFPALAATEGGFKNLAEFFESSRTTNVTPKTKKDMEKFGLVTSISDILAKAASSRPADNKSHSQAVQSTEALRAQLLRLCTRDGTPEQARNSVLAISSLINPLVKSKDLESRIKEEKDEFLPLLKALVNPSRLSIPDDDSNSKHKSRIISVLSAIAAISECAPYAFNTPGEGGKKGWGQRALHFALGTVLLGKRQSLSASMDVDDDSESEDEGDSPKKKSTTKREASVHAKMICGAIEVLVSHIKSTTMKLRLDGSPSKRSSLEAPSSTYLSEVFGVLAKIIEDGGVPPSSVNGRYCKTKEDQAELRRCAAINLIRLSDSGLKLDEKYLTPHMWSILSGVLLDRESSVRGAVMEELANMFTGSKTVPSLRFVALVTLCVDGESGYPAVNAHASNVGKRSASTKTAAIACIKNLRSTFQSAQAQCRSMGRKAEKNFENSLKMKLMPEYSVPYGENPAFALHLLAFRHETPGAAGALNADDSLLDDDELANAEASQKMLKKRLKWLFDPLVQSLGESADNISFLLRMVELAGKHPPIDVKSAANSSLEIDLDNESVNEKDAKEAAARMQVICQFARESLLAYVKKDVNLTVYPGSIALPADLFAPRLRISQSPVPNYESESEQDSIEAPKKTKSNSSARKRKAASKPAPAQDDDSVFGDEEELLSPKASPLSASSSAKDDDLSVFGNDGPAFSPPASPMPSDTQEFDKGLDVSPIIKADSPVKSNKAARKTKKSSAVESKKRKTVEIQPYDEFPSPLSNEEPSFLSSQESSKRASGRRSKKGKTTPVTTTAASTAGKGKKSTSSKKPTPVSVDSKAMINITNSKNGSNETNAIQKKRSSKKASSQSSQDEFDFSHSPAKKAVPARKSRASAKSKVGKAKKAAESSPANMSATESSLASARPRRGRQVKAI
eukprot:scaffold16521_cov66-Cyclotella_meneghiniana.AAC.9